MVTAAIHRIDRQLSSLDPQSLRAKVLFALRRFRSSWIELGKLLTDVAYGGDYKEWGYDEFEVYCAQELGLKKPTVQKLMLSYHYLKRHEPRRLEAYEKGEEVCLPDYQTVELLHRVRDRGELEEKEVERFHEMVFEGDEDEMGLRRELRARLHPSPPELPNDEEVAARREREEILRLARHLRRKLAASRSIPQDLCERLEELLLALEALPT